MRNETVVGLIKDLVFQLFLNIHLEKNTKVYVKYIAGFFCFVFFIGSTNNQIPLLLS